jgi:hypothetical protein
MTWQQFLTEKVLKECYHEGSSLLNAGYHCRKCDKIFSCNRTFDNRSDLLDLYEAIYRDGKWDDFSEGTRWKHTMFSAEDFAEVSEWLFCLNSKGHEERCKMVAEFYGWEEADHD